ncbi:MAG: restriction endonuclease subunit S [Geobacteraceae bacterium]|nr:restriction endonuclease subunit S [Geobacteraceae bacterium]
MTLQRGYDITKSQQKPGNVPVVSSGGISSFHNEAMVSGPGVVLGRKGSLGTVFYINEDFWPHDTSLWVKDFKGNNPKFVYYFFNNMSEGLKKMDVGAANPALNRNHVHPLPVKWPVRGTQDFIVSILSSLDNKIKLNRLINQTLEQIAQTIFKSWFVDFEPVYAKIEAKTEGRDPERAAMCAISGKSDTELDQLTTEQSQQLVATAALFPDELDESELGLIPKGWKAKPLDRIANYLNGLALQKFPPESDIEWLPVIKIAQLKKGNTEGADRASLKLSHEYVINDGDVLFSWSGSLEVDVWCGGPGALNQHLFKVTSADYPKWFYLQWTKHHLEHFKAIAAGKAVTMGHIQRKHLTEALCAVPPVPTLELFGAFMVSLLEQQIMNRKASRTLTTLRDTLLPKLLADQISC